MDIASALVTRLNGLVNQLQLSLTVQAGLNMGSILERLMKEPAMFSFHMAADDDDYWATGILNNLADTTPITADTTVTFKTSRAKWTITTGLPLGSASRNIVATFTDAAGAQLNGFAVVVEGEDQFGVDRSLANGNAEVLGGTLAVGETSLDNLVLDTFGAAASKVLTGNIAWRRVDAVHVIARMATGNVDPTLDSLKLGFGDKTGAGALLASDDDVKAVSTGGAAPLTVTVSTTYHTISFNWAGAIYDFVVDSTLISLPTS